MTTPPIEVLSNQFVDSQAATDYLQTHEHNLHVMALDVPAVSNTTHWHHFSSRFYITEGQLQLTDTSSGQTFQCKAGDMVCVPAKALHSERSKSGYSIVLGTTVPATEFGEPVDLSPELLDTPG